MPVNPDTGYTTAPLLDGKAAAAAGGGSYQKLSDAQMRGGGYDQLSDAQMSGGYGGVPGANSNYSPAPAPANTGYAGERATHHTRALPTSLTTGRTH